MRVSSGNYATKLNSVRVSLDCDGGCGQTQFVAVLTRKRNKCSRRHAQCTNLKHYFTPGTVQRIKVYIYYIVVVGAELPLVEWGLMEEIAVS